MERQKRVAAIHDISCVGRCSLTVALPILSAAGFDTGVLPTAVLSTHTGGFEGFTYRDLTEDIEPIAKHWQSLDLKFDALYSGFLGSFAQIDLVADLFKTFRKDDTLVMVDPVMADNGVLYSVYSPEMAKGMAKLCSMADIIVPNLTEAAFMLEEDYVGDKYSQDYVEKILRKLSDMGAKKVVLTGISFDPAQLGAACYDRETDQVSYAFNERVEGYFHGTGDVFGSTLLSGLLNNFSLAEATQIAVDYTLKCIQLTVEGNQERRYGVCFERALPYLIQKLGLLK
ncbi:Pyridoxine/pyridoxal/pyridoxamine kinase [bioreactor metagenome]|uniref:pyridoxal kinase n=2 Tax=root TaxID=1 RepID=A0A098AZN3_DESHA|nr:pyridoxamine kinase [Desulfitobacterium hafniense]KTE90968.1 pyridoxal kinase [Desulfitobacterium hafniense]MEA5024807.1 pyridoxamine kinase [Desulfitobacterium hafniense]CDX01582.1 Pyridoxal/pyridoxine/pyridoxamine kinase [Desulfitobacterium hafniense]